MKAIPQRRKPARGRRLRWRMAEVYPEASAPPFPLGSGQLGVQVTGSSEPGRAEAACQKSSSYAWSSRAERRTSRGQAPCRSPSAMTSMASSSKPGLGEEGEEPHFRGLEPIHLHQRIADARHVLPEDPEVDQERGSRGGAVRAGCDPGDPRRIGLALRSRLIGDQIRLAEPDRLGEV